MRYRLITTSVAALLIATTLTSCYTTVNVTNSSSPTAGATFSQAGKWTGGNETVDSGNSTTSQTTVNANSANRSTVTHSNATPTASNKVSTAASNTITTGNPYAKFDYNSYGVALINRINTEFILPNGSLRDTALKSNVSYLWGLGSYMESCGTWFKTNPSDDSKQKYKDALQMIEKYYSGKVGNLKRSYSASQSGDKDVYYDDNVWVLLELENAFDLLKDQTYQDKAKDLLEFINGGYDETIGGGIWWYAGDRSQKGMDVKNTCINAPFAMAAAQMYIKTNDSKYLTWAKRTYDWTKSKLLDTTDNVFWDKINTSNVIDKSKYAYNSGCMLGAAVELYKATKDVSYLNDAKKYAEGAYNYFGQYPDSSNPYLYIFNSSNTWFSSSLIDGYVKLYDADKTTSKYVDSFLNSLGYGLSHNPDARGYVSPDWRGLKNPVVNLSILDQAGSARVIFMLADWCKTYRK
jgi:hypothetical protein